MAFPSECVGPVCDSFLERTSKLLTALRCCDVADKTYIARLKYSVLTLQLFVEKNSDTLLYISLSTTNSNSLFLSDVFKFILQEGGHQRNFPEITEMLLTLTNAIFECKLDAVNDWTMDSIISLLMALPKYEVKKVSPQAIHLAIKALSHVGPKQEPDTIAKTRICLEKIFECTSFQPVTSILIKSVLIQILSLIGESTDTIVNLKQDELVFLENAIDFSGVASTFSRCEALGQLKVLMNHSLNKILFLNAGFLEILGKVIEEGDCAEQALAADLITKLLLEENEVESSKDGFIPRPSKTNSHSLDSISSEVIQTHTPGFGAVEMVQKLLPCILNCFENFRLACEQNLQSKASMQLMYTSTLVKLILDVLEQENESVLTLAADEITKLPEIGHGIVLMLWGSTVVLPINESIISELHMLWINTFFDILNCVVQWTSCSSLFCQLLIENGLIHFFEMELKRLGSVLPVLNQWLTTQTTFVLTIFYNCVQKPECSLRFFRTRHLDDYLVKFTSSTYLFVKFQSKLCMGFLSSSLHDSLKKCLELNQDEIKFVISNLEASLVSSDYTTSAGYSCTEFLHSLRNILYVGDNFLFLMAAGLSEILIKLLRVPNCSIQEEILLLCWNSLANQKTKEPFFNTYSLLLAVTEFSPDVVLQPLHKCLLFMLKQLNRSDHNIMADLPELVSYFRNCYKYKNFSHCIEFTTQLLESKEPRLDPRSINEAKLLKGKSLYYEYQGEQRIYLKIRSTTSAKIVEPFKSQFYQKTKECILLLGSAHDNGFLDAEGNELLDRAMIDYVRETNSLKDCKRCLLCLKRSDLRRSHIIPKSILKEIAKDLVIKEDEQKVFVPLLGKTIKKSPGDSTFWLLCSDCEERLCQNGENQFIKEIHRKVCFERNVVTTRLTIPYGNWLYDFAIGLLFRTLAISDQFSIFGIDARSYNIFTSCRKHLLALPFQVKKSDQCQAARDAYKKSTHSVPSEEAQLVTLFFVNPRIASSVGHKKGKVGYFNYILKAPGLFLSPICLEDGVYAHNLQRSFFLAHFDHMNLLIHFAPLPQELHFSENAFINCSGGKIVIPDEHKRWQSIPTGVWQIFNAFAQACENFDTTENMKEILSVKESEDSSVIIEPCVLYPTENTVALKKSAVINHLPCDYVVSLNFDMIKIYFPNKLTVLMQKISQWGQNERIEYYIVFENENCVYSIVFVIAVPGLTVLDGCQVDEYTSVVKLPFLNRMVERHHPIDISVIQSFLNEQTELTECLKLVPKLS